MIEYVGLASGSAIRSLNNSTIIIQTQDPWTSFVSQVLSVVIGGIIALIANYFLQKHNFDLQNRTNMMNQRISAYNSLLGHIANYGSSINAADMGLYLIRAASYGSPEIKDLIKPIVENVHVDAEGKFEASLITKVIIEEIMKKNSHPKHWWLFWR